MSAFGKPMHHRPYFVNPLFGGADPCICQGPEGFYYFVTSKKDGIYLYRSRTLTDPGVPTRVFTFPVGPDGEPLLKDVWAPEIHEVYGQWYIYFAASEEPATIENWPKRRMYALHAVYAWGPFRELNKLELDENMSIDGTVLQMPNGDLYMVYMRNESPCKPIPGNPTAHHNKLYIAKMSDPLHVCSKPVQLIEPEYPWEGDIVEGAFPLIHDGKVFLLYSANAAHLPEYCLGLLTCVNPEDPMDPKSWVKSPEPIFKAAGNVFGPGHASVVPSADRTESWLVYHSKYDHADTLPAGWNRLVNMKKIEWNEDGTPNLGEPAQYGEKIPLPSGESDGWPEGDAISGSASYLSIMLQRYAYSLSDSWPQADGIHMHHNPHYPTKLLFRRSEWTDAQITWDVIADCSEYETGLIARASYASAGHNRLEGYLALFRAGAVTLYRCDGEVRTELASAPCTLPAGPWRATLRADGDRLTVYLGNEELCHATDATYPHGRMGFYCDADTHLRSFDVRCLP
jgi:GH43 family beta-xylosidase